MTQETSSRPAAGDASTGHTSEAPPARRRGRRVGFAVASILLGLGLGFLLLEIVLRVILVQYAESIDRLYEDLARRPGQPFVLRDLIRPSSSPRRIYELQPGARGLFVGVPVEINSAGYRDREWSREKPPGTLRVAVLGDSVAFGWGVPVEERFSNRLESMLNDRTTSRPVTHGPVEVLNFAVPGYNSMMELATLREHVLDYEPDALVVSVVPNDAELPNFVREKPQVMALNRSFVVEAIRDQARGLTFGYTARQAGGGLVLAPEFRPELVPEKYRPLMGMENAARALNEIASEARRRQIPVVALFSYPRLNQFLRLRRPDESLPQQHDNAPWIDAARRAGMVIADPLPELVEHLQTNGLTEQAFWVVPGEDLHPNGEAHRIMAEVLGAVLIPHLAPENQTEGRTGSN